VIGYQSFGGLCCLNHHPKKTVSYHITKRCHNPEERHLKGSALAHGHFLIYVMKNASLYTSIKQNPPKPCLPEALTLGVNRRRREANH